MLDIKNLDWLGKVTIPDIPEFGTKLRQALLSIQTAHNNIETQTNTDSSSIPSAPPSVNGITVKSQNGHFSVAVNDANQIYRGISYFVEHADNPHFTNPTIVPMGPARNMHLFLGNVTRYFRAYSAYGTGPSSAPVYHGGNQPVGVLGGGSVGGPSFLPSQGSGTGDAGVGLVGYGPTQFRSTTGIPPPRKVSR